MATYPTNDLLMDTEMGLAFIAAVDLRALEVDIVRQPHFRSTVLEVQYWLKLLVFPGAKD